jgi:hypothetical protein
MTADQKLVAEATRFLEENRKHLPGVVARYLGELLGIEKAATIALARQQQEIADLRAILYGNPDGQHDRNQAGGSPPPQVFRQGGWEDA